MKQLFLFFLFLIFILPQITADSNPKHLLKHKIRYKNTTSIRINDISYPIMVKGIFRYNEKAGISFEGEIKFSYNANEAFPFRDILEKEVFKLNSHLDILSPVIIIVKEKIKIKYDDKLLSPVKVNEGYQFNIPESVICKNKLYFVGKKKIFSIIIKKIMIKQVQLKKYENIIEFTPPFIDNSKVEKYIKLKLYFDKDKNLKNILVIDSNFTKKEEKAFVKAIKNGKILQKEDIGSTFIYKYSK